VRKAETSGKEDDEMKGSEGENESICAFYL
jgi:hypothetical protein